MDITAGRELVQLIRDHRTAALGTLLDGHPLVTMILFNPSADLSAFDIHVSRLAQHTQAMSQSPRVALLIAEADRHTRNPQTLSRLAIQGIAEPIAASDPLHDQARASYLARFPQSALNFNLGDFALVRIQPVAARFVSGFGKIFDLTPAEMTSHALQTLGLE